MNKYLIAALAIFMTACASYGPVTATGNAGRDKMGQACKQWALVNYPIFTWGRNDIFQAANNGKITKISIVDSESRNYLVYGVTCTNVYGE